MKQTRRQFLKGAALASAAWVGMSARSYARILGANDRVLVGLVGFSDRAKDALLPAFFHHASKLNFEVLGISDLWNRRRIEGRGFLKDKTGLSVRLYNNNDELYADREIDAVIISTADFQHALHAAEAALNKKDAYVEKPFAETMPDNIHALQSVKESGVIFQVGSQRRSGKNYQKAYEFIRSGQFGDIKMVEMSWNVNQPGRWRRPALVESIRESDTDWKRYLMNRPIDAWDPRKYVEYRLFWPYSSGIPGQWMCHQIDTVHWFSGYLYPRSVVANGGLYMWVDGRTNYDTMTAVLDYGPKDDPHKGFQVVYTSRMHNAAGGVREIYFSNGGELNLDTNRVTSNGGLTERHASAMGMKPNLLSDRDLADREEKAETAAQTGTDRMTAAHMLNWMECVRSRKQPNAPVEAGYHHSIATIMVTAALHTREVVTFDEGRREVLAGGHPFLY